MQMKTEVTSLVKCAALSLLKQRQLRDALVRAWRFHLLLDQQRGRQFAYKGRRLRLLARTVTLAHAGTEQDHFLPGARQPDVDKPPFFGDFGSFGLYWQQALFQTL